MTPRIYISGPMTGLPEHNYPAFNEAARRWRRLGWNVENPAEAFDGVERGATDTDGLRHTAKAAWRVLALLQAELEAEGAPLARGARLPDPIPAEAV